MAYRLQRVRLVIGGDFREDGPIARWTVTCRRSVGEPTPPCDVVHCSSQRAAASPRGGCGGVQIDRYLRCGQKEYVHRAQRV